MTTQSEIIYGIFSVYLWEVFLSMVFSGSPRHKLHKWQAMKNQLRFSMGNPDLMNHR